MVDYYSNPLVSDYAYYMSFSPVLVNRATTLWFTKDPPWATDVFFDVADPYYNSRLNYGTFKAAELIMGFQGRDPKCSALYIKPLSYLGGLGRIG